MPCHASAPVILFCIKRIENVIFAWLEWSKNFIGFWCLVNVGNWKLDCCRPHVPPKLKLKEWFSCVNLQTELWDMDLGCFWTPDPWNVFLKQVPLIVYAMPRWARMTLSPQRCTSLWVSRQLHICSMIHISSNKWGSRSQNMLVYVLPVVVGFFACACQIALASMNV